MKINNTIEINAPAGKVFYWFESPDNAKQWMKSVSSIEITKQTPSMIGTRFEETVEEGAEATAIKGIVTDFIENKRLSFYLRGYFSTANVDYMLEENRGVTVLKQSTDIHFKGILSILSYIFSPWIKKRILKKSQQEFLRLKDLCEQVAP